MNKTVMGTVFCVLALGGCGDDGDRFPDARVERDASAIRDAGSAEDGSLDSAADGAVDDSDASSATPDAGTDAMPDSGTSLMPDSAVGVMDDAGMDDAGSPDAAMVDSGTGDGGASDSGTIMMGMDDAAMRDSGVDSGSDSGVDGAMTMMMDGGMMMPDAGQTCDDAGNCGPSCSTDDQCMDDMYCVSDGYCIPRRTDTGLNIGPVADEIESDGETLCYLVESEGSPDQIWAWDLSGEPMMLASYDSITLLEAADGYCYISAPEVRRVALDGSSNEVLAAGGDVSPPPSATQGWLSPQYFWWVRGTESDGYELLRTTRTSTATVELVRTSSNEYVAGNETYVFYRESGNAMCRLYIVPLSGADTDAIEVIVRNSLVCFGNIKANETSVYYNSYFGSGYALLRIDLTDPQTEISMETSSSDYGPVAFDIEGDTVYTHEVEDEVGVGLFGIEFRRLSLDGSSNEIVYVSMTGEVSNANSNPIEIVNGSLVTLTNGVRYEPGEPLIYGEPVRIAWVDTRLDM